jgi:hypothetical protein
MQGRKRLGVTPVVKKKPLIALIVNIKGYVSGAEENWVRTQESAWWQTL